jgi:hypothetical protein
MTSAQKAYAILRVPVRSAKHKMSLLPNAYGLIGLSKGKKRDQGTPHRRGRLYAEADEEKFFICQRLAAPSIVPPRWN